MFAHQQMLDSPIKSPRRAVWTPINRGDRFLICRKASRHRLGQYLAGQFGSAGSWMTMDVRLNAGTAISTTMPSTKVPITTNAPHTDQRLCESCTLAFGNYGGLGVDNFGGDAGWGTSNLYWFFGTSGHRKSCSVQRSDGSDHGGAAIVERVGDCIGILVPRAYTFPMFLPALHQRLRFGRYRCRHR